MARIYWVCLALVFSTGQSALAGNPLVGAGLYTQHCSSCHGAAGRALIAGTPDFVGTNILMKPDFQLMTVIKAGKSIMPAYQGLLTDSQIRDVIAHLRTFF